MNGDYITLIANATCCGFENIEGKDKVIPRLN
jgi:hypothetical protein